MNLTESIIPKSDQVNADDLMAGPITFTIESVTAGSAEQPINIALAEAPGRAYRPSKSMRRVLVAAWGPEASAYTGRRLTLFRDPEIKFGGIAVGGIAISHLSHIDRPMTLALTVTRGKRSPFVVEPLTDAAPVAPTDPTATQIADANTPDELMALWNTSSKSAPVKASIAARKQELDALAKDGAE